MRRGFTTTRHRAPGLVVRRCLRPRLPATAIGLATPLLLIGGVLAGCAQTSADPSAEGSAGPQSSATPTPSAAARQRLAAASPTRADNAPTPSTRRSKLSGGGFASTLPGTDAPDRKADTGPRIPLSAAAPDIEEIERLVRAVERVARQQAAEQPIPTSGSLADAVGTFTYRYFANGAVQPDPAWVAENIRTEAVPILGKVTCHKVMLPQLRGALQDVVERGLAAEIHPGEYAGCYVPRFIERNPARGLSLHTWGIAADLNVPGNLRGTRGEINREVVAIFKAWGFAWGGDWNYTDPMHFELARLVRAQ
jgi:hypothetical protein